MRNVKRLSIPEDWISLLMVFGVVNSNVLSLMCDFLVLMLPLTDTPVVTESTSYFDQLFSVSGVLAPAVDTRTNFRLQQWTWSYQNFSLFSFLLFTKFVSPFVYMTTSLLWVLFYFASSPFVCTLPYAVIIKSSFPMENKNNKIKKTKKILKLF